MNSKIKKTGTLLLTALIFSTSSCTDWNDHYESTDVEGSNTTLWQQISARPELSDFAEVLSNTMVFRQHRKSSMSYAEILNGGQSLTVMAPVNGTFNKDSLLQFVQTAQGDSAVERFFVMNHLTRTPRSAAESSFRLLNDKRVTMTSDNILGVAFMESNLRCKNGILHVMESQLPYNYTIYEALTHISNFSLVGNSVASYNEDEFDEDASVSSGLVDGIPVYVDSVVNERNKIMEAVGRIDSEDSTYFAVVPTNAGWQKAWDEASTYFRYPASMEKGDSLQRYWTNRALLDDAVFSNTIQSSREDSVISYHYSRLTPEYHVFYKPFSNTGIFGSARGMETCSNGFLYYHDEWPFTPEQTYFKKVEEEAESYWDIISYEKCTYNATKVNGDSISKGAFLGITASSGTANWKVTYKLSNTLSGMYDFCVVVLPKTVNDPNGNMRPCKFKATINYIDSLGAEQTYDCGGQTFTSNPYKVDTIVVAQAFKLPACNYNQSNEKIRLTIQCNISSKENSKYNRAMYLDGILLRPVRKE